MAEYPYSCKTDSKVDPRAIEAFGYGEFKFRKVDGVRYYAFDTEAGRTKFLKNYGGEVSPFPLYIPPAPHPYYGWVPATDDDDAMDSVIP